MTYKKKLIEVALPLDAISEVSVKEKNLAHGHPQTLHKWWARRPLAAARAVLWSSLVDDPSAHPERFPDEEDQDHERQRLFRMLEELVKWENTDNKELLEAAKAEILASCDGELPNVLDPFCGGGTIPLEAQRLGLSAYGGDLNPVAVLISKAMVEIPPRFAGMLPVNPESQANAGLQTWNGAQGLAEDIRYYGEWLRERAFEKIGHLYPKVQLPKDQGGGEATVIAWIWARTVESPDPSWNGHVPLVRSWVLRKEKKNKPVVWAEPVIDRNNQTISYRIREGGTPVESPRVSNRADFRCIATGSSIPNATIRKEAEHHRLSVTPIAVVVEGPDGQVFVEPSGIREVKPDHFPDAQLPPGGRYMAPPLYGFTTTSQLFLGRQLEAMATFSDLIGEAKKSVRVHASQSMGSDSTPLREGGAQDHAYAEAVATFLAFVVDKCADWWSTIASWDSSNSKMRNAFGRQALPMTWDFAEVNPFSDSTGNWTAMVDWIARVVEKLPANLPGEIAQSDAGLRIKDVQDPVISTDPPYYDNIGYADLADFFYVWLRNNVGDIWPEELLTLATPKAEELVANPNRHGGTDAARMHFEAGMAQVFEALASAQNPRYPSTIYYAYKQEETSSEGSASTGWETFLRGLINAGLTIEATWPIEMERRNRPIAAGTSSLASSIVIACRPRSVDAARISAAEFVAALRGELPDAIRLLQKQSIAPVDMAQSAIGPGIAVFSRYTEVVEANDEPMSVRRALILVNEVLQEVLSEEETEFDPDTRWALTWFEQHGLKPGPFGDADVLSKAKNTSVRGVVDSGIAVQREGKVRLKGRDELVADWDPSEDPRPTVWEATQHLIAGLGESESKAADLLRRLGSDRAERARQLSYLLYQLADRKGWADEAVAYNGLVQAWTEISRLVGQSQTPVQQTLGE